MSRKLIYCESKIYIFNHFFLIMFNFIVFDNLIIIIFIIINNIIIFISNIIIIIYKINAIHFNNTLYIIIIIIEYLSNYFFIYLNIMNSLIFLKISIYLIFL